MAGIAGWITLAAKAADEARLGPMVRALERRGSSALLGYAEHNRNHQAVIAASLIDKPARIALALDGVPANVGALRARLREQGYTFSGTAPEEVLLRAYQYWDKDLVKHLVGAFAFAIWDGRKDRLFVARDRFGQKPLYLHARDGGLYFASQAKALLSAGVPAEVDLEAVHDCLVDRYAPGPRTLFARIRKLPPAGYAVWQLGRLHEARYWVPPDRHAHAGSKRAAEGLAGFVSRLDDAVKAHPAQGLFLSGGLDSTVLLALMCRAGARPKTFSLGVEGDPASELPQARRVAKHFGTDHAEIAAAPHELLAHLEFLIACRDAPLSRPSDLALCRLASEAARTVGSAGSGDGCDEVLGGYRRYVAEAAAGGVSGFPARLLAPLVSGGRFDGAAPALKLRGWRKALLGEARHPETKDEADPAASPLRRALYLDQSGSLPDQLLERNDCVAAAAGIETALPFLDHRLVEYVSSLPDGERVRGFTTKRILREAARALVPGRLVGRQGGWRLDVAGWLRNELRELTLEHLRAASSRTRHYYDAATLDRVLDEHFKGKKNHEVLLWTLLNIEIWHRTYALA